MDHIRLSTALKEARTKMYGVVDLVHEIMLAYSDSDEDYRAVSKRNLAAILDIVKEQSEPPDQ
jgi:hypothetical protein